VSLPPVIGGTFHQPLPNRTCQPFGHRLSMFEDANLDLASRMEIVVALFAQDRVLPLVARS